MIHNFEPNIQAFSTERYIDEGFDLPYNGFNINPYCGDTPRHVTMCKEKICKHLRMEERNLLMPHQVHGTRIVEVTEQTLQSPGNQLEGVDGLITSLKDICICVSTADCVPLLFFDMANKTIAAVHAGWRGTLHRIGVVALSSMYDAFGTRSENVRCVIGPSIGPEAFEVGDEVYEAFHRAGFPMQQIAFRMENSSHMSLWHINLWKANEWQLLQAGVLPENISITGICTYTNYHRFFSARRLGTNSGRILNGIMMR